MVNPSLAGSSLLLLIAAPSPAPVSWESAVAGLQQQRITIHVPRMTVTTTTFVVRTEQNAATVIEKRASDCVKMDRLAGFTLNRNDSVDLLLKDGGVLRAHLASDCPALGFYSGFYIKATSDSRFCARRDALRTRSGRQCAVQSFATLKIKR